MRMIGVLFMSAACIALGACGPGESHAFPGSARAEFNQTCHAGEVLCECMWAKITHDMTYEEYDAALERYRREGLMHPRIAHARTVCLERYARPGRDDD